MRIRVTFIYPASARMLRVSTLSRLSQYTPEFQIVGTRWAATSHAKGNVVASPHPIFDSKKITTVGALLDEVTAIMPDKDLYHHVESSDRWTCKEALSHINSIANGLAEARIPGQKRVAVIQQSDTENVSFRLGALKSGVIPAHIDISTFNDDTVLPYLDAIQPRSVLITPKYDVEKKIEHINDALPQIPQNWQIGHPLRIERFPDLKLLFHTHKSKFYDGWYAIKDLFWYDETPRVEKTAPVSPSQINEIHFPRFSPGSFDPLMFTHESVVQSAFNFGSVAPFSEKRVAFTGEYSHPEVMTSMLACIAYGSYIVGSTYWFRASDVIKNLSKEQCSVLVTTPSHLASLLSNANVSKTKYHLETILVINNPNDMASNATLKAAKEMFKAKSIQVATVADGCMAPFLHTEVNDFSDDSNVILGAPIPNSESQISDEEGKPVSVGTTGSLHTKGVHTMSGVLGKETCSQLDQGWLNCGISAALTKNGVFVTALPKTQ